VVRHYSVSISDDCDNVDENTNIVKHSTSVARHSANGTMDATNPIPYTQRK